MIFKNCWMQIVSFNNLPLFEWLSVLFRYRTSNKYYYEPNI